MVVRQSRGWEWIRENSGGWGINRNANASKHRETPKQNVKGKEEEVPDRHGGDIARQTRRWVGRETETERREA